MPQIILVAHNLRSAHNVGSLLRTAEGLGALRVYLSGYTPYPAGPDDERLPHLSARIDPQIAKTALGAERHIDWKHESSIDHLIHRLHEDHYTVAALEQTADSIALPGYRPPERIAIIVGREVEGLETEIVQLCDVALEIPMFGSKESFNVVQAAAMALYHCRFAG